MSFRTYIKPVCSKGQLNQSCASLTFTIALLKENDTVLLNDPHKISKPDSYWQKKKKE